MKVCTQETAVAEFPAAWQAQYGHLPDSFRFSDGRTLGGIREDLRSATAAEHIAAIVHLSWIEPPGCDECGGDGPTVQLGDEPDHESNTAWICGGCLRTALDALEAARG